MVLRTSRREQRRIRGATYDPHDAVGPRFQVHGWWASFGVALAAVDFNGDGYDDLLALREVVAARYYPKVFLYLGSATGLSEEGMQTLPVPADVIYGVRGAWGSATWTWTDTAISLSACEGTPRTTRNLQILHGNPSARLGQRIEEIDDPHLVFFAEYGSGGDFNGDGFADVFTGGVGHVVVTTAPMKGCVGWSGFRRRRLGMS